MPSERDFEWMREQVLALRDDMAAMKAWRDNQNTQYSRSAAWILGAMSAIVGIVSILANIWINTARP